MQIRKSLRRVATIAGAEVSRTGGTFNKKTLLALVALGLIAAFLVPNVGGNGFAFDNGIYRAVVTNDSPLAPAIDGSRLFRVVNTDQDAQSAVNDGAVDIAVTGMTVYVLDTSKGNAALAALKQAAKDYTYANLLLERDQAAAFPVRVEVNYIDQDRAPSNALPGSGGVPTTPSAPASNTGGSVTSEADGTNSQSAAAPGPSQGFDFLPQERSINTPETLSPPFPFRSLLLAYAFLIPMNFVVQIYAGSAIGERLARKGETLLASPARPWEIIAGKALPYFALMMLISAGIVYWIGAGWLSLLAVAPLALAFLALEFVAAMFARSFRELTFLTVFASVIMTIYAFLPAVFTSVHPIALVSPIALVVFDLRHDVVPLSQILYATLPLTLVSTMLFVLGASLYREEDLFHQKPVLAKAVDAVSRQVTSIWSGMKLSFLLIPLVFVTELLLITFLFAWPVSVGTIGVLLAVALVEESFKGIPSYAGVLRGKIPMKRAVVFGALVGLGFFLAEKGFLLASLVGLMDVPAAAAVFGSSASVDANASMGIIALLLAGPLLLHVGTASLTGWGATQGRGTFWMTFVLAVLIHTIYNFAIVNGFAARLIPGGS